MKTMYNLVKQKRAVEENAMYKNDNLIQNIINSIYYSIKTNR